MKLGRPMEVIEKFNPENIDRDHIVIFVEVDGTKFDAFFMLPSAQGYQRSNLKKLLDGNSLPDDTDDWVGKKINCKATSQGFLRVAL